MTSVQSDALMMAECAYVTLIVRIVLQFPELFQNADTGLHWNRAKNSKNTL
jgi:hypothetical protein